MESTNGIDLAPSRPVPFHCFNTLLFLARTFMLGPIRSLLGFFREGAQGRVIRVASLGSSIGHVGRPYLLFEAGVDFQ
jgi:hypothetical protein